MRTHTLRLRMLFFLTVTFFFPGFHLIQAADDKDSKVKIDSAMFGALDARSIGTATTSGRISYIEGVASNPRTIYVGAANGGVWRSINGGTTFKPIFDKYTQSIGAITVDQAHPDTVWVGTGESWTRNSTSVGTGLYKTTDGGENWQLMGLEKSERITKIVVDPKNSDTVYVAVVGHLWDSNEDRGLYKTTNGGKTWEKILYVNADTGCSDVALDPQETNVVYAGMWQFRRYPWAFSSGGPGSGLHKSTDGGKTWQKITKGLPEGDLGRIAIAVSPSRPNVVYANVEAKKTAFCRSEDMGESWTQMNTANGDVVARPFYFSVVVVDPKDYNRVYKPGFGLSYSKDGGRSFSGASGSHHGDDHALWIDPNNPAHMYLGTDGGVYESYDTATSFRFVQNLPVSQFYHVAYDMEIPYNVYGGLQDNGSWFGPSRRSGGIRNKHWKNVGFGDGFCVLPDPLDKNVVYSESQGGKLVRYHKATGEFKSIQPFPKEGEPKYRCNWNTPLALSPKNPKRLYYGAQFLFRSTDQGESWERISDDLTTNDPKKLQQEDSGGLSLDNSSAENHCTIFTINESPLDENVIWVGTDDGNLQVTRDNGKTWTNLTSNISGLPANTWVSCIETSHFDPGTAYATFDGHATGDMKVYVYKTTDFGKTWKSISTDTLKGFAHVVREDLVNANLLFVGTEFGLFITVDGGQQWAQFTGNLPNVAIRDIAIHQRDSDVLLASHGRGIYILDDITPLRQITDKVLQSNVTILESRPAAATFPTFEQDFAGDDEFFGSNPSDAAIITYYLKERHVFGDLKLEVYDSGGKLLATLPGGKRRGINRVVWQTRMKPPKVPAGQSLAFGAFIGPMLPEGTYTVKLIKGTETYTGQVKLVGDPKSPHSAEDRKQQQELTMKLYQMQERLAFVDSTVTDARDQALERVKKVKEQTSKDASALTKALEAFADKLDTLHKSLVATREGRITGEERLRERVVDVYGDVSRYGGKPTQSQVSRTSVLEKEIEKANQDFNTLASAEVDSLNTKLQARKLDPIKIQTQEEYDKKQKNN